jgi:hypothetical protein
MSEKKEDHPPCHFPKAERKEHGGVHLVQGVVAAKTFLQQWFFVKRNIAAHPKKRTKWNKQDRGDDRTAKHTEAEHQGAIAQIYRMSGVSVKALTHKGRSPSHLKQDK